MDATGRGERILSEPKKKQKSLIANNFVEFILALLIIMLYLFIGFVPLILLKAYNWVQNLDTTSQQYMLTSIMLFIVFIILFLNNMIKIFLVSYIALIPLGFIFIENLDLINIIFIFIENLDLINIIFIPVIFSYFSIITIYNLYILKMVKNTQQIYGTLEFFFALLVVIVILLESQLGSVARVNDSAFISYIEEWKNWIYYYGGIYVGIRGMENIYKGLSEKDRKILFLKLSPKDDEPEHHKGKFIAFPANLIIMLQDKYDDY